VTGLRVAGVALPVSSLGEASVEALALGPSENSVSVDFLGIGTSLGEELRYQYKLDGADDDWSAPTPERTVTFANLAAGTYRLLVRAVDADGRASAQPAAVAFTIAAPVWQRWWFLALAGALAGLAAYALHRYRIARLLEVERVRTRIATDLHDDIGANLTRISVLSEVASYRSGGDDSLASIARISRESVESMSDIVWAVDPKHDSFRDLVRRMRELADEALTVRGVDVRFSAPESDGELRLGHELRRQLYLIFKEAVNNASRHSGCTRAEIAVGLGHGGLALEVADDGRGFDPASESEGNGLVNMRRRAEAMGARLEVRSAPGEGTAVRLEVPMRRGHPL
jgi:signal transduction histidine kinase